MIPDITKNLDRALNFADDSFESGAERQATLTERLKIDMASDNQLAKMIRPIIALTLLFLEVVIVVSVIFGVNVPEHIVYELGAMLGASIGFYFNSRKAEKIAEKKANAYVKVEAFKAKAAIEKEKILLKEEVRDNKEERKEERKANRKPLFGKKR